MSKPCTLFIYPVIAVLLLTFHSCSRQKEEKNILSETENIIEQHPDSALRLLNTVLFHEDLDKRLFNKYHLLLLQAKDKSYKDIASDTVIFSVKEYYVRIKDLSNAALAAFYCGRVRHEQNNIDKAVEAYAEAENLAEKTDNHNLKGLIQANQGILHSEHSSYDKAIELIKNAVVLYAKAKNHKNEIGALRITGDCFLLNNKPDSAFRYYNESLKLAVLYNMPELQSDIKQCVGIAYREQGLYEQAKKLFNEAFAFSEDSVGQARILLNIAKMYILEEKTDSANLYLDKALALTISDPWLKRYSYLLKSEMAEENKRYMEALNDYKEYYRYTTELFDSDKNNKLLEVQGKYDFEKLKNLQNQWIIKQQKAMILLSLALLAAGIIIFVYYRKSVQDKRLLLETEQKIEGLQKMADNFSKESRTFRHVLLKQFDILKKTALIKTVLSENEQIKGRKLLKKFNEIVYEQDTLDWNQLYQVMDNLKNGLYSKIRSKYPQWSETEFRICCFSCEPDFTDKETEIILGITLNMVRRIRSDLRKKIGMFKREGFLDFFENSI